VILALVMPALEVHVAGEHRQATRTSGISLRAEPPLRPRTASTRFSQRLKSLRSSAGSDEREATEYIRSITSTPEWNQLWKAPAANDEQRRVQVGAWIAQEVSAGLAETTWGLRAETELSGGRSGAPDLFLYSPRPRDLLGWIYFGLAHTLTSARSMRGCDGCGVMFLVRDERQRFHDKQCAQRARYRRAAEKRRQGA
jgi:hypothetical protein